MTSALIELELSNGRKYTFPYSDFEFFTTRNELEHKEKNIIITLSALENSFVYEKDNNTEEIINKEYIPKVTIKNI